MARYTVFALPNPGYPFYRRSGHVFTPGSEVQLELTEEQVADFRASGRLRVERVEKKSEEKKSAG